MQIISELPREVPVNELQGRKFFIDVLKWLPELRVDSELDHEEIYWAEYTMIFPFPVNTLGLSDDSISIVSDNSSNKYKVSVKFAHQDPNNTTIPLRARFLLQQLISQIKVYNESKERKREETNSTD